MIVSQVQLLLQVCALVTKIELFQHDMKIHKKMDKKVLLHKSRDGELLMMNEE